MSEVVAFPQQRLAQVERERVREAITKVQTGWVAATFAEIHVGLAGQAGLTLCHRLDHKLSLQQKVIETPANDRVALRIEDDSAFEIAGRGQSSHVGVGDGMSVNRGVILLGEDRDDCRRIRDHAGSPRSS